jgi:glycosyltransferase involved in cell wall biosynthesis
MKNVPVSVIIPCYNCSDTIERAVLSVVNQTARPLEMLLIDDGSPDNTLDRLSQLQEKYGSTWIRVVSLPRNQGPAAARNAGWDRSCAPYLALLDADDAWHPEKIHFQYGWMKNRPDVGISSHACLQLISHFPAWDLPETHKSYPLNALSLLVRNRMLTRSVMLKRSLPYRFSEDKRYSEDYLLWLEMVMNGIRAWYLDIPLAASFKHAYGEAGLSRHLMAMEKGELDTYARLRQKRLLPTPLAIGLYGFSLIKHLRRLIIHWIQKKT